MVGGRGGVIVAHRLDGEVWEASMASPEPSESEFLLCKLLQLTRESRAFPESIV